MVEVVAVRRPQETDPQRVQVVYFNEEQFPPHTLALLWQMILEDQQQHPTPYVFTTGKPPTLNQFVRGFGAQSQVVLQLALYVPEGEEPKVEHTAGFMWIDEIEVGMRASAHFYFFWQYHGGFPLLAVRQALPMLFAPPLDLRVVQCRMNTNNTLGVNFMKRLGVTLLGEMPAWYRHGETYYPAVIGYLERDAFLAQQAEPKPAIQPHKHAPQNGVRLPPLQLSAKENHHAHRR